MQTFLPYADFAESARVLDTRRLGKQRVEALQILRALTVAGYGWRHHPAAAMWAGYEEALVRYGLDICREWSTRGHSDTCADKLRAEVAIEKVRTQKQLRRARELPPWLGDEAFHRGHQAALLRKDAEHYERFFVDVPADLGYDWPASDRARRVPLS